MTLSNVENQYGAVLVVKRGVSRGSEGCWERHHIDQWDWDDTRWRRTRQICSYHACDSGSQRQERNWEATNIWLSTTHNLMSFAHWASEMEIDIPILLESQQKRSLWSLSEKSRYVCGISFPDVVRSVDYARLELPQAGSSYKLLQRQKVRLFGSSYVLYHLVPVEDLLGLNMYLLTEWMNEWLKEQTSQWMNESWTALSVRIRHYQYLAYIILFNPPDIYNYPPFYRWLNWGWESLKNSSKFMQLLSDRAKHSPGLSASEPPLLMTLLQHCLSVSGFLWLNGFLWRSQPPHMKTDGPWCPSTMGEKKAQNMGSWGWFVQNVENLKIHGFTFRYLSNRGGTTLISVIGQ